jgi:hypothetical protein
MQDPAEARAWVAAWRSWDDAAQVTWEDRVWHRFGGQTLPVRAVLQGADAIADAAGAKEEWRRLAARAGKLRERFAASEALAAAVRGNVKALAGLDNTDWRRALGVLEWLETHPTDGVYQRQLPIRGVDTKWVGRHVKLVTALARAVTGRASLGLRKAEQLVRLRVLDPDMRPLGLAEFAATVEGLAALDLSPDAVLVFENLESVVALPDVPGAVAVHGSGYAVDRLAEVPWIHDGRVLYWGDLDSNGFAILAKLRAVCPNVVSVMMDKTTIDRFQDLAVIEGSPKRGRISGLTPGEDQALAALRAGGDLRLEQERIAWPYALDAILAQVGRQRTSPSPAD